MPLEDRIGQTAKPSDTAEDASKHQFFFRLDDIDLAGDDVETDAAGRWRDLASIVRHAKPDAQPSVHTLEVNRAAGSRLKNTDCLAQREVGRAQRRIEVV